MVTATLVENLWPQFWNGLIFSGCLLFRKINSCRQHTFFVLCWRWRNKCFCDWMLRRKLWMMKTNNIQSNFIWNAEMGQTLKSFNFRWQLKPVTGSILEGSTMWVSQDAASCKNILLVTQENFGETVKLSSKRLRFSVPGVLNWFCWKFAQIDLNDNWEKNRFWDIVILPSNINWFMLNLIDLYLLFKFATRESFKLVNRKLFLYEILKAKLCNSEIKWWMLAFLISTARLQGRSGLSSIS